MSFITTKLLGYLSGGLGIALALALAFGWVQTTRLSSARETIDAKAGEIRLLTLRTISDRALIASRDELIAAQNKAVRAMAAAAARDRAAYLARIAAAEKLAKVHQTRATDIMARSIETTDELERSRAALALIQEMIGAETP